MRKPLENPEGVILLGRLVPGDTPVGRGVGDAGDSCLNHQLRAVVELHPHLAARQLAENRD